MRSSCCYYLHSTRCMFSRENANAEDETARRLLADCSFAKARTVILLQMMASSSIPITPVLALHTGIPFPLLKRRSGPISHAASWICSNQIISAPRIPPGMPSCQSHPSGGPLPPRGSRRRLALCQNAIAGWSGSSGWPCPTPEDINRFRLLDSKG